MYDSNSGAKVNKKRDKNLAISATSINSEEYFRGRSKSKIISI